MKFVKRISLFFVYPLIVFGLGMLSGIWSVYFFYPGVMAGTDDQTEPEIEYRRMVQENLQSLRETSDLSVQDEGALPDSLSLEAAAQSETLNVDTQYVIEEADILRKTVVETSGKLPGKYIGMDREQFLDAMEEYEAFPPLSALERGFTGLEVLSFSEERVVVQMNYKYVQPSESFYLAVRDHEVVVLLEDMETVYINTGILLETLPDNMQLSIIQMYYIEDEEGLYNFLETYSS